MADAETGPDTPIPPPPPSSVQSAEAGSHEPKWWKRAIPIWAVALIAFVSIGLGAASTTSDEAEVAAIGDVDELESQLAGNKAELDDRAERIEELTNQVESLESDLVEATSTTTTRPPTTTTTRATTTTTTRAPTTTTTAPPVRATTADPFAGETVSQRNARRKGESYLDYSAFSRSGLIDQLKYEGFSQEDATYGTDALNADWFEQAAKKAEDYMEYSSFSRSGLIEQLKYEGFTQAQAEHGADSVGL